MIRCCLCARWFHLKCVEENSDPPGVWPCPECRRMPGQMSVVSENLVDLKSLVIAMNTKLDNMDTQILLQKDEIENLSKENKQLKEKISTISTDIKGLHWKRCRDPSIHRTVVLGDFTLKDFDQDKLVDTEVLCKPKCSLTEIQQSIKDLKDGYEEIIIVTGDGLTDLATCEQAEDVTNRLEEVLADAKRKAPYLTHSSICPRRGSSQILEKLEATNAGIKVACSEDTNIEFVDNRAFLYLGDGSVNEGFLAEDGIHLTNAASNRLAKHLGLRLKSETAGVCRDKQSVSRDGIDTRRKAQGNRNGHGFVRETQK